MWELRTRSKNAVIFDLFISCFSVSVSGSASRPPVKFNAGK